MHDTKLCSQLAREIKPIIRTEGNCSIHLLIKKIGPSYAKFEFWEVLRYHLSDTFQEPLYVWRNPASQELMLTWNDAYKRSSFEGWYKYELRAVNGVRRFYIPPIPLANIQAALRRPAGATTHTLETAVEHLLAVHPELHLFNEQWQVLAEIVAPALFASRLRH